MNEINFEDISLVMSAKKKVDAIVKRAEKGVPLTDILAGQSQTVEAPSTNKLIEALFHRITQYEKGGERSDVEFTGTKAVIEKKLANPAGLTAADIATLQELHQRINAL